MIRFLRLFQSFVNLENARMALASEAQSLRDRLAYAESESAHWREQYAAVNNDNILLLKSMVNEQTQRQNGLVRFPEAWSMPANLAGPQEGPTHAGLPIMTPSQKVERRYQDFFRQARDKQSA